MKIPRLLLAFAILLFGFVPLLFPFLEAARLFASPTADDLHRLSIFLLNTLLLLAGVLLLALPLGTLLAVVLYRTDLPGRAFARGILFLAVFVPLPLIVAAWQAALGPGGWLAVWQNRPGQPWASGLLPAIWVQAMAGIPWVVVIVGQSLLSVEAELEEEALLRLTPWSVCWDVTLPRCRPMIASAGLFVALQAAGDITVTYLFEVPTLAAEAYLQFALGDRAALARALIGLLPWLLLAAFLVSWTGKRVLASLPTDAAWRPPLVFPLGRARIPLLGVLALLLALLAALPITALVDRLGRLGPTWSGEEAWRRYLLAWQVHGHRVFPLFALACLTGLFTACLGLFSAWILRGARFLALFLGSTAFLLAALPGPVVGIGLFEWILQLTGEPTGLVDRFVYREGPLAVAWARTLRAWPFALAVFWPLVAAIPREHFELARLEGKGIWRQARDIILPSTGRPLVMVSLLMTALNLGELSASYRVETPGSQTFARLLFDRMHYGVESEVAAPALLLLTVVIGLGCSMLLVRRLGKLL